VADATVTGRRRSGQCSLARMRRIGLVCAGQSMGRRAWVLVERKSFGYG
jgi:hypothetical protein